ncbi:MAG TPA: Ig-like domain-containing protein [Gemmatimonadaceae bacterium]|nr:Ig-like domain-containing protein [Gemmatimonadaceae bacterium]
MRSPFRLLTVGIAGLLAACTDSSPSAPHVVTPSPLQTLSCVGQVHAKTVTCTSMAPRNNLSGQVRNDLIIGGQGTYVQLTSSNVNYDSGTEEFQFSVTVQNLITQPLGTADGTTADPNGIRIFFSQVPTATSLTDPSGSSAITIINADGTATFTASGQQYYQYDSSLLGGDGILSPNETSGSKTWIFQVDPNVNTFSFFLYVSAEVPKPTGYVDVTATSQFLLQDSTQTLTGVVRNAVGTAAGDTITWASSDNTIATVDSNTGIVTGVAPGTVTITASNHAATKTGTATISVCPNLAVGQAYATSGSGAAAVCVAGGTSGQAEYTAVPFNGEPTNSISLVAGASGITSVTGPPTPDRFPGTMFRTSLNGPTVSALAASPLTDVEPVIRAKWQQGLPSLMSGARISRTSRTTSSFGVRAFRAPPSIRKSITPGVPSVGDTMHLNVAQGCSGTPDIRTGVVREVSAHAIIVADTGNPAGGFTTAQYTSIALQFDTLAYPVDSANFGAPTDVDGNGHIVIFYTRAVNELTPPASSNLVQGYFASRDVFSTDPVSGCALSNAGEMIYMLVPDPTGAVNSNVRTVATVQGFATVTLGHQLQHLINAWRRVYVTGASAFEESWLDEGLSSIAEELLFYKTSVGLAPRGQIQLSNLTTGPSASRRVAAFNSYANGNYTRFRSWLQRPDTSGPYRNPYGSGSSETGGIINSAARGSLWAFLRYAADRVNGNDQTFWSTLVNSNLQGSANLQNAIGDTLTSWYRDFDMAMYADDNSFSVVSKYATPSWNYRSVYGGLGGFPLLARPLTNNTPLTLSLSNGASTFYRFGVAQGGFASFATSVGGVAPPSTTALVVMRTK